MNSFLNIVQNIIGGPEHCLMLFQRDPQQSHMILLDHFKVVLIIVYSIINLRIVKFKYVVMQGVSERGFCGKKWFCS